MGRQIVSKLNDIFKQHFSITEDVSQNSSRDGMKTMMRDATAISGVSNNDIEKRLQQERREMMKDTEKMMKEKLAEKKYDEQLKKQEEMEKQLQQDEEPELEDEMPEDPEFGYDDEYFSTEPDAELELNMPNDYRVIVLFDKFLDLKENVGNIEQMFRNIEITKFDDIDKKQIHELKHFTSDLYDKIYIYLTNSFEKVEYSKNLYVLKVLEKELVNIMVSLSDILEKNKKDH